MPPRRCASCRHVPHAARTLAGAPHMTLLCLQPPWHCRRCTPACCPEIALPRMRPCSECALCSQAAGHVAYCRRMRSALGEGAVHRDMCNGVSLRAWQVALQQAATDPVTGAIDMDLIQTGVSASERIARAQLAQEIKQLLIGAPATLHLDLNTLIAVCLHPWCTPPSYTWHEASARAPLLFCLACWHPPAVNGVNGPCSTLPATATRCKVWTQLGMAGVCSERCSISPSTSYALRRGCCTQASRRA